MPFVKTLTLVIKPDLADALLDTLSAVPGAELLDAPEAILFTNTVQFTPETELADLTLATFVGYAPDALGALLGPVQLPNGARGLHAEVDFIAGAVVAPGETIWGYAITNGAGTILYGGESFADGIPIANPGDFISLDVIFGMPTEWPSGY